jgi:hypothetical protein
MANLRIQSVLGQAADNRFTAPARSTGLKEQTPLEFDDDVGYFSSIDANILQNGVVVGGINTLMDSGVWNTYAYDPAYNILDDIQNNPDWGKLAQDAIDDQEHPDSAPVLQAVAEARNAEHARMLFDRIQEAKRQRHIAEANGIGPIIMGTLGGIGVDVAAVIGISMLTGGTGLAALGAGTGARGGAARAAGALKGAALGAAEGGGERAIHQITNPLVTNDDIWLAAGLGAGLVGAMGAAAPHRLMGIKRAGYADDDVVRVVNGGDDLVDQMRGKNIDDPKRPVGDNKGGSVSAAAADDANVRIVEPGRGSASLLAQHLTPHGFAINLLRNPKRVIMDFSARGVKQWNESGLAGNRMAYSNFWSKLMDFSTANADEIGGGAARDISAARLRTLDNVERAAREKSSHRIYAVMAKEIFDLGWMARTAKNAELSFGKGPKRGITHEEFEAMSDEFAIMRGDAKGGEFNVNKVFSEDIISKTTPEQRTQMIKHIEKNANEDDAFYKAIGEELKAMDLIDPDMVLDGYRPQRWNSERIIDNPDRFRKFIIDVIRKRPEQKWLEGRNYDGLADEGDAAIDAAKVEPVERKTWDELSQDKELAREIIEDWSRFMDNALTEKRGGLVKTLEKELATARASSYEELLARKRKETETTRASMETWSTKLEQAKKMGGNDPLVADEIDRLATNLGKAEVKFNKAMEVFKRVKKAQDNVNELDALLGKYGKRADQRAVKGAQKKLAKAEGRVEDSMSLKQLDAMVDDIAEALQDGKDPYGLPNKEFTAGSARFKQRSLFLGDLRSSEEARHFLLTNSAQSRSAYVSSVSTNASLYKAFGVTPEYLKSQGLEIGQYLRRELVAGFREDLSKPLDNDTLKQVRLDQKRQLDMFEKVMNEYTHHDIVLQRLQHAAFSDTVGIANSLVATMSLGNIFFSLWGDLATVLMAGAQMGTGFGYAWRGLRVQKHIDEMAEVGEDALAIQAQGLSVVDSSHFRTITGLDIDELGPPGSLLTKISRKAKSLAVAEGWMNGMHPWNKWVRGGFGLDIMRQFDIDFADMAKIPDYKRTFYARHGITASDAKAISTMLNKHHKKLVDGKLRIPDSKAWQKSERGRKLLQKYQSAMQGAGDEALIDPGLSDRPFLRATPFGRMVMQFQAFMQTVGERVIAPMVQEAQIHPTSVRPYMSAALGLALGTASDGARAHIRGDGEEWRNKWDSGAGIRDLIYAGLLRSPFMPGSSATASETAMMGFGRQGNDIVENIAGVRPFGESATRFRERNAFMSLLGPTVGKAEDIFGMSQDFADGEFQRARDKAERMTPLWNVWQIQTITRLMKD